MSKVLPGIYKHYKGGLYRVLFSAKHTETEEPLVIYQSVLPSQANTYWARPESMFTSFISHNHIVRRFTLMELEAEKNKLQILSKK